MRVTSAALMALLVLAAAGLSGCQSMAMDNERTLAAAGFQMKLATTPEQTAQMNSLPQRKLTQVPHDGQVRFVYADAKYCKCIYVGTEAAYDRYQKLEVRQQIAQNMEMASMNWGAWGAWGPWW